MTRLYSTLLAAALTASAAAALAQPASASPPPRETFPAIGVYGYGKYIDPAVDSAPLRRAAPDGDIRTWLPDNDPTVTVARNDPKATGGMMLELDVASTGAVASCTLGQTWADARLSEGLCDRVARRARLKPAINDAGAPVADRFVYTITVNRSWRPQSPLVDVQMPSPAPPPSGGQWPPYSDPVLVGVAKVDLLPGGPASPLARAQPWAGVVYAPEHPSKICQVVKSSGDADFDRRACKAATKARYDLSRATSPYEKRIQLHFVLVDGKPRALVPVQPWTSRPAATEAARTAVLAAVSAAGLKTLRLDIMVEGSGAVTGCTIAASSGADASDVAACAAARAVGPLVPARDIFGRPFKAMLHDWSPASP